MSTTLPSAASAISIAGVYYSSVTVYFSLRTAPTSIGRVFDSGESASGFDSGWVSTGANPRPMTNDGTSVFYATQSNPYGIYRIDPATQVTSTVMTYSSDEVVTGLAADSTHIYYAEFSSGIWRIEKDGSNLTQLVSSAGAAVVDIDILGSTLYFTERSNDRVRSVSTAGGAVTDVVTMPDPAIIAVSPTVILVSTNGTRNITRYTLDGTLLDSFSVGGFPFALDIAGNYFYVTGGNSTMLRRYDIDGTNPFSLSLENLDYHGITVMT